jgi:galactokinase/mevalonate kinase-like predicted kinase
VGVNGGFVREVFFGSTECRLFIRPRFPQAPGMHHCPLQRLLSLPPGMARAFTTLEERPQPEWFATCDPVGAKLGSGGGTAHLLAEAWRATGSGAGFAQWLGQSRKLLIHGGGQSRRLPSYAPVGKLLLPLPVFRWAHGQRLDQTLLDVQLPDYERVLQHAGPKTVAMITSGDVLLRFAKELPPFPDVDVLGLGMWVTPEKAKDFGVFFSPRNRPTELAFFLQKPEPDIIRSHTGQYLHLVDTGMWLLSERAVRVLMAKCGWDAGHEAFAEARVKNYELYAQFGLSLGRRPTVRDLEISSLTSAVIPLPEAEFYHFGTSRQLIESVAALQNLELDETKLGLVGAKGHPDQFLQNSNFKFPLRREENHTLWVENSSIPATWRLAHEHVFTGVPDNQWDVRLEPGVCMDFVPVGETDFCLRAYGFDDSFSGKLGEAGTKWFGRPIAEWFAARSLELSQGGLTAEQDIQQAALFPVLQPQAVDGRFIEWLFAAKPEKTPAFAQRWLSARRLSAQDIADQANLRRVYAQREKHRHACLAPMLRNGRYSVFYRLDLQHTAKDFAKSGLELPPSQLESSDDPMHFVHDDMFRAAVLRQRRDATWSTHEDRAFGRLRDMIIREAQLSPALPRASIQEDQIVWGRSPVRLDLAGGWTDTPPYCLAHGGKVLNLAVNLNGQPPIQVFAKLSNRPELVVRSIDLGVEQRLTTYEQLDTFAQPGSEFALAKAAFALAGFLPRFHGNGGFKTLEDQLRSFGGGIEISMLSAVPKGSGLGTSSILAATLLATLGDLCGLGWDRHTLFQRTLAMEQMLTTGGGWQDQAGAIFGGVKLIETSYGLAQAPNVRWLPPTLFGPAHANSTALLYYTGLTRMAKNILQEIVRGMFLNSPAHLRILGEIGANAEACFNAIQRCRREDLVASVRTSWQLNQRLDAGTNTPEVAGILRRIEPWTAACKLLGAGGGGFVLIFAHDEIAAGRIRHELTSNPPNPRARFVEMTLSESGFELTRS